MAKQPTLSDVANILTSATTLNNNWDEILSAFDNTLSRDGSTPNQMEADLDMNSQDILNVNDLFITGSLNVGGAGIDLDSVIQYAQEAAESAEDAVEAAAIAEGNAAIQSPKTYQAADLTNPLVLDFAPATKGLVSVYIDGVKQDQEDFTLSGDELTFTGGWPDLIEQVEVVILGAFATLDQSGLVAHETLDDFEQWVSSLPSPAPNGSIAFVDGRGLIADSAATGFPTSPAINNWRPSNDVISILDTGTDSDLSSDFVGRLEDAVDYATARKLTFALDPKRDRTPYEYEFIDHTLTGNVDIKFNKNAILMPTVNFQHFTTTGTGSDTVYSITDFSYSNATNGTLSAMLVDGSTETKLTEDTDFTVSGTDVTLLQQPPSYSGGGVDVPDDIVFVVAKRNDALRFRSTVGSGYILNMNGELVVDQSRFGYVTGSASGSALSTSSVDHIYFGGRLYCGSGRDTGYGSAPLDKRGDSGFVPLGFLSCFINSVHATGCNDLAVYASGGGSSGFSDDSRGLFINSIYADRCSTALKYVRQGRQGHVGSVQFFESGTGVLLGETGGIATGRGIHIASVSGKRFGRRLVDVRDCPESSITFGSVTGEDMGFLPDGATAVTDCAGVFLAAASGVTIDNLHLTQTEWSIPSGRPVVQVSGTNNYGNRINGGYAEGYAVGITETGGTTNDVGNEYKLTLKDVATPLSLEAGSSALYDLTLLTDTAGTITADYKRRMSPKLLFVPQMYHAGEAPETHARDDGTYVHDASGRVTFSLDVQVNGWTFTPSGNAIRISLPKVCDTLGGEVVTCAVTPHQGINTVGLNVSFSGEIADGQNYLTIRWTDNDAGTTGFLDDGDHTSGSTVRIKASGSYFVAE